MVLTPREGCLGNDNEQDAEAGHESSPSRRRSVVAGIVTCLTLPHASSSSGQHT